jgi:hypothetical protein
MNLQPEDLEDLQYAHSLLENPGLAARITNVLGTSVEQGFDLLPKGWSDIVANSTEKALQAAVNSAVLTMRKNKKGDSANSLHKLLAAGSGAAGGFWGLPALPVELSVSTAIMLRSIADIARSEGQLISDAVVKVACIEVFALGGPGKDDDAVNTGYFATRSALASAVTDAASHIASKGLSEKSAPVIVRLISLVSTRFGIQVSEKVAAQAIPVIGAVGGALINTLFIDHFQSMARGHFIILRLEEKYDPVFIQQAYEELGK